MCEIIIKSKSNKNILKALARLVWNIPDRVTSGKGER